jgi:hypothetical protein
MDGTYVGEKRDACRALVIEFERKNHLQDLGLHGDNIKMDLKYIGYVVMDWIYRSEYWDNWWTYVNVVMNLRIL